MCVCVCSRPWSTFLTYPRAERISLFRYIFVICKQMTLTCFLSFDSLLLQCVNMFNRDLPDLFDYITRPSFEPGMPGLTSVACKDFLVCCDCTNSCVDRSKCACWQLTLEEAKVINNSQYSVGYVHHRLKRAQHSACVNVWVCACVTGKQESIEWCVYVC